MSRKIILDYNCLQYDHNQRLWIDVNGEIRLESDLETILTCIQVDQLASQSDNFITAYTPVEGVGLWVQHRVRPM